MVRYYRLTATRTGEPDILGSFCPLEAGMIIGWGADDAEPDGIKRWLVEYEIDRTTH